MPSLASGSIFVKRAVEKPRIVRSPSFKSLPASVVRFRNCYFSPGQCRFLYRSPSDE
uniref:Uncharacterized protein n=1 Tax=Romanomermis culicivorax TaxID=13658 RepID=A0A915JNY6_ROMCU